jgi:hypothetical protein
LQLAFDCRPTARRRGRCRRIAGAGPLVFGIAAAAFGGNTWALCLLLVPLAAGAWLLATADLAGGRGDSG